MNNEKNIDKAKTDSNFTNKFRSIKINPWIAGAVIGFLAASLQTIASMTKPPAYGFCMACHARDLINTIINQLSGEHVLGVASIVVTIPTLTVVGVLSGSFVASRLSKEFRISKGESAFSLFKMFILGMLVMIFALILSACPIRASLRAAHGDIFGIVGLICIGIGAIFSAFVLQKIVRV